jgi:hypothetical protein
MARTISGEARRSDRDADRTRPVRTIFLRGGVVSALHRHEEETAWFHVVDGEIVEERWTRDNEGGFLQEHRRLKGGQSMAAPADALHRIAAREDAVIVSTCASDCACCHPASPGEILAVAKLARDGEDRAWAATTSVGDLPALERG